VLALAVACGGDAPAPPAEARDPDRLIPGHGVILPIDQAPALLDQCTDPDLTAESYGLPSQADIDVLDGLLPTFLRSAGHGQPSAPLAELYRRRLPR